MVAEKPIVSSGRNSTNNCHFAQKQALGFLGLFHLISFVLIVNTTVFEYTGLNCQNMVRWWVMPIIVLNALVSVGITAPISNRKPSCNWRSLSFLWLLIAYILVSVLV